MTPQNNWAPTLAADSAGAATNAADFTKNFLSQLTSPPTTNAINTGSNGSPMPMKNGTDSGVPNQLHNPGPEAPEVGGAGRSVSAPRRGRGVLQQQQLGMRTPVCGGCQAPIK